MLSHDPAFHLPQRSTEDLLPQRGTKSTKTFDGNLLLKLKLIRCLLCLIVADLVCGFRGYSANHPLALSSLTPIRLLPSMSSTHEPFTSAVSLPPDCGVNCTVEPTATSTSTSSVAPPRLILVALAFA